MNQSVAGQFNAAASGQSTAIVNVYQTAPRDPVAAAAVHAAAAVLEDLPLEAVPGPVPPPAGSVMPHQPNRQFVGRDDELRTLARVLKHGGAAAIGQSPVVTGAGGIGKSQLAIEAVWRYGRHFKGGVFWLSFADPAAVPGEIARCGNGLGLHDGYGGLPLETQVGLVSARWQDGLPRLLVFDNCEDPELFRAWCPPAGECRVILTGRRAEWPAELGLTALPLQTLARGDSIALLRRHRPDLAADDRDLDAIAAELGDFPLALHLAGRYLARYRRVESGRPARYLEELRQAPLLDHASLAWTESGGGRQGSDVHRTFTVSTRRLDAQAPGDALARAAFDHAAHFAPGEPIPPWLLARALGLDWADAAAQRRLVDALARLAELGLVEIDDDGAPVLHRLLAAFARHTAEDAGAARSAVEKAVFGAAAEQNRSGLPGPLLLWQAHLRHVAEHAAAASLLNELGYHLQMIADYPAARDAFQRTLAIAEAAFGLNHPEVATCMNNLGTVLRNLNEPTAAQDAYRRALVINEAAFGPDHPKIAVDLNNQGEVLHALGNLPAARDAFRRALAIDEAAFGPDHPEVATDLSNLATVLRDLGELTAACDACRRALAIDEAALGPAHPIIANRLNNLGTVLHDVGEWSGARDAYRRALAILEQALGADHPNTVLVRRNLKALPPPP